MGSFPHRISVRPSLVLHHNILHNLRPRRPRNLRQTQTTARLQQPGLPPHQDRKNPKPLHQFQNHRNPRYERTRYHDLAEHVQSLSLTWNDAG